MKKVLKRGLAYVLILVMAVSLLPVVGVKKVEAASVDSITVSADNFGSEALANFVKSNIAGGSDGVLTASELSQVTTITMTSAAGVTDLSKGLQLFDNLTYLDVSNCNLTVLNLAGMTKLQTLKATGNAFTSVDLWGCTALTTLELDDICTTIYMSGAGTPACVTALNRTLASKNVASSVAVHRKVSTGVYEAIDRWVVAYSDAGTFTLYTGISNAKNSDGIRPLQWLIGDTSVVSVSTYINT